MPNLTSPTDEAATARAAAALLVAGTLARLLLAVLVEPGLDEAYAMAVARVWQGSWFDHPPMTFWTVEAMRALAAPVAGPDPAAWILRLPFVLAFTATSWALWDLTRRLWGARAALWTLVALTLAPFFLVSAGSWLVPDGPLVLFLALSARALAILLFEAPDRPRERRLWLGLGLTLGLAGLSKYHAALFAVAALAFVVATPHRRRLASPWPWIAVALAVVVVSPVILWNAGNDWVSFAFQAGRGGGGGTNWIGFGRALLGQLAYLGPWTAIGALLAAGAALRADRRIDGPAAFLVALAVLPIVLFTAVPLLGGDSLPHWQMPGWLFLLPLLGRAIAQAETRAARRIPGLARLFARIAAGLLAVAALAVALLRIFPPTPEIVARFRLEKPLAEATSWTGLAAALDARGLLARDAAGRPPVVIAFRWMEAARLGEALGSRATVAVFDDDPRGFAFLSDPRSFLGRDLVLIGRPETFARGLAANAGRFAHIDAEAPIRVGLGGRPLVELDVALGRDLKTAPTLPYPKRP
ncbi:glycosyltransferase family 39 protein [Pinisolibacter aquiterrae]|uniref:glycosyltransferase family 39 protein n=1 Tax=Pinisolibacter aquiterrae TaxID=2815579 RepID=UPI001C3D8D51|nr:glycosyltransferase family 39 protein [Pinisolibacter aquiterrae]MBV5266026.1 glycosyltransferase family 39 protein [Pinisolibacter aquiterrae]MCC8237117.1 glycosyltransferase family 39 protein [Pinisolibacter aquiterrae]